MRFSPAEYTKLKAEVVADPDAKDYAAIIAAFPTWVFPLTQELYDELPSQATKDAYDADIAAWEAAVVAQLGPFQDLFTELVTAPDRDNLSAQELYNLIDDDEGDALTGSKRQALTDIFAVAGGGSVDISPSSKARRHLMAIFPSGGPTFIGIRDTVTGLTQTRHASKGFPGPAQGQLERLVRELQV